MAPDDFDFKNGSFDDEKEEPMGRKKKEIEDDFFDDDDFNFDEETEEEEQDHEDRSYRSKRVKSQKRRNKMIASTIIILVILALVAVGVFFGWRAIRNRFFADDERPPASAVESITVPESLALSADVSFVIAGAREDLIEPDINFMFYSKYDSINDRLISLSIPVKTLMEIPGFGLESADRAVEYGGMDLLTLTLKKALAMDIDNYVLLDVASIVKSIGDLDIVLDSPVTIESQIDGSAIELPSGPVQLDSDTAVSFLKFYSGSYDTVPISQNVMAKLVFDSLFDKMMGAGEAELEENLNKIIGFVDTNFSMEDFTRLVSTIANLEEPKNVLHILDVTTVELEGNIFYVPDISRVSQIFRSDSEMPAEVEIEKITANLLVLNGNGVRGIAKAVGDLFVNMTHEDGTAMFNILAPENADSTDYDSTQIVVNSQNASILAIAEIIQRTLARGSIITGDQAQTSPEIVIIVGNDLRDVSQITEPAAETVTEPVTVELVKINILNGEGTAGLATTAQKILLDTLNATEDTIEVTETKNADNFNYTQTKITVFKNEDNVNSVAQRIQEALGLGVIESGTDNVDNVDISVTLGSDYTQR